MSNNISLPWQTSPVYQRLKYTMRRLAGTGAGESSRAACKSCRRGTWARTNLTRQAEDIPPAACPFCLSSGTASRGPALGQPRVHSHEHVRRLVPKELILLRAVLSALYVVTGLVLAEAPGGILTIPILQMRKPEPREVEVTCSRSQGWSGAEPLCLHSSSTGLSVPRSGLSNAHLGTGLSTKPSSGKYWQVVGA